MGIETSVKPTGYILLAPTDEIGGGVQPADEAAIYLHFPFCLRRCSYCDFDTFTGLERLIEPYLEAVVGQIRRSHKVKGASLYIGGGTPSLMAPHQVERVVRACMGHFGIAERDEITLEANPADLCREKLEGFRAAGVNRLSIGVQSTDPELLRVLGRRHDQEIAAKAIDAAREAGFTNISVDLIFGVPNQSLACWERTLRDVVDWGLEHISCYSLTVEPGTPLERDIKSGQLSPPSEDDLAGMYCSAQQLLAKSGYTRYEISNWSKPGFESQHNLTYWRFKPYLGIGAGAASFFEGRRYKIHPHVPDYIEWIRTGRLPLCEDETVDLRRAMSDFLILGLRLAEGISIAGFQSRFGMPIRAAFGEALDWGVKQGLLLLSDERIKLTAQGTLLANEVFEKLL